MTTFSLSQSLLTDNFVIIAKKQSKCVHTIVHVIILRYFLFGIAGGEEADLPTEMLFFVFEIAKNASQSLRDIKILIFTQC